LYVSGFTTEYEDWNANERVNVLLRDDQQCANNIYTLVASRNICGVDKSMVYYHLLT
jgi:hypothetical protein